eukprot:COSAG01_NODE_41271_length_453_cov_1.983051_1_plen_20_part_10
MIMPTHVEGIVITSSGIPDA